MDNVLLLLCFNIPYVIYGIIYFLLIGEDVRRFHRNERPEWERPSLYTVYAGIGLLPCFVCMYLVALWIVHPNQTFPFYAVYAYFFSVGFLFYISELWLLPRLYIIKTLAPAIRRSNALVLKIFISLNVVEMLFFFTGLVITHTSLSRLNIPISISVIINFSFFCYSFMINLPIEIIKNKIDRLASQKPKE